MINDTLLNFLGKIPGVREAGRLGEDEDRHIELAEEVQRLLGGDLKDYLRLCDRDLRDLLVKGKTMKINDFRNRINQAFDQKEKGGAICKSLIQNLVSEFGKLVNVTEPFNFSIYNNSEGELVYESRGKEKVIDELSAESTLDLIHTFRDDLIITNND